MSEIKELIAKKLGEALEALRYVQGNVPDFDITHPEERNGDYSTNLALKIRVDGKSPRQVAEEIVSKLSIVDSRNEGIIEKIEVAGPGFINFYLKVDYLVKEMDLASDKDYGNGKKLSGKKVVVEYTDPNPFKEMHIGHLMSNTIGESIARIIEAQGASVARVNYQGDVGMHVSKAIYGLLLRITNNQTSIIKQIDNDLINNWIKEWQGKSLVERQKMMGQAYAEGATRYEEDESAKQEMAKLNKQIYDRSDESINQLYDIGREWSLEYFETIYLRLGTKFDEYFFESQVGKKGLEVVEEGLAKKILEIGENGAVVYKGEKEGLHTRVFRNALGLATYEAKELGLSIEKYKRVKYDLSYIVTANEITEYFKVLLSVMKQLYPELSAKTRHIAHGMMKLTTGKMSSRTGKVITAESLLNELKEVVLGKMGEREISHKETVADRIAVGALKYTVLKQTIGGDIVYEPEKMTNLEGDTGPYIQYTYARCASILRKHDVKNGQYKLASNLDLEELKVLRCLYRYPEVVEEAGRLLSPHLIVTYITDLSARFNSFYQACRVEENGEVNAFRYKLTGAVANVLKLGLTLLGIVAVEEM